jgi:hypothetical protein
MSAPRRLCVAALATALGGVQLAQAADPRVCALRNKDADGLKDILAKLEAAGKPATYPPEADAEALRGANGRGAARTRTLAPSPRRRATATFVSCAAV